MNFCPKCGTLLQVIKKSPTNCFRCPKCKYQTELIHEKIKIQNVPLDNLKEIAVIDKKTASLRQLPTVRVTCQICGHTESETWQVETANETIHSTITFFRCTNCGITRRESG